MSMSRVRITRDPDTMGGKPVLEFTRWPTEIVLAFGCDVATIKDQYPFRTISEIESCIAYERSLHRRLGRLAWRLRVRLAAWLLDADADHLRSEGWG